MLRSKSLRIDRGLTQKKLSDLTGIPRFYLGLIERNRINPTEQELKALAKVLGCDDPARLLDHISAEPLGPGAEARDAQREADRG